MRLFIPDSETKLIILKRRSNINLMVPLTTLATSKVNLLIGVNDEWMYLFSEIFFNDVMPNMPSTADQLKKYCLTDSSTCARFMVSKALGSAKVPKTLFPNQIERAEELITAG